VRKPPPDHVFYRARTVTRKRTATASGGTAYSGEFLAHKSGRTARAIVFQDLPLLTERGILAAEPLQLDAFVGRQAVRASSSIAIGLRDPIPNALRRRLELASQRFWAAAAPHELD
jgi:hypothetical protein